MVSKRVKLRNVVISPLESLRRWRLEAARNQLSEVVRLAAREGPQLITVRGREAAVVMAAEDYRGLGSRAGKNDVPLVEFLQGLGLRDRSVHRESIPAREEEL